MAEVQVINEYGICIHHVWGEIMGDEVLKLHRTSEDLWILQKFPQYVSWIMENCPSKFSDIGYAQKLIADEKAYHSFKQKLDRAYRNTAREWVKKMILGDEVSSYPIFVVRWNGSNYDEEDFVNDLLCTKSLDSL